MTKLTKRTVDGLTVATRPYFVYDEDLPGFGMRVGPTGAKSWLIEYRANGGGRRAQKRRYTLGPHGVLTPDQARKAAQRALADVRLGADPAEARQSQRRIAALLEMLEAFMREEIKPKRAPATAALYRTYVDKHVAPALGSRKVNSITHADIARLHREIGRNKPATANRILIFLSGAFSYAARNGFVDEGFRPCKAINRFKEEPRDRYLTGEELQRLGAALIEAETVGLPPKLRDPSDPRNRLRQREVYPPHLTGAIRLLLFTGCRLREILHLRWVEIDFERGLLFLPKSKTGKKTVVLSAMALEVLQSLPRASDYVIAGMYPDQPRSDLKRPWDAITSHAQLDGLRLHDLRHSFASVGAGAGLGLPIIGKLLGHSQLKTTERYAHLDNDPLRRATNFIGANIAAAMGPHESG